MTENRKQRTKNAKVLHSIAIYAAEECYVYVDLLHREFFCAIIRKSAIGRIRTSGSTEVRHRGMSYLIYITLYMVTQDQRSE